LATTEAQNPSGSLRPPLSGAQTGAGRTPKATAVAAEKSVVSGLSGSGKAGITCTPLQKPNETGRRGWRSEDKRPEARWARPAVRPTDIARSHLPPRGKSLGSAFFCGKKRSKWPSSEGKIARNRLLPREKSVENPVFRGKIVFSLL
jgi:hypothetical protein